MTAPSLIVLVSLPLSHLRVQAARKAEGRRHGLMQAICWLRRLTSLGLLPPRCMGGHRHHLQSAEHSGQACV